MATTTTTIFNGDLELPFTTTDTFTKGDYVIISVPALAELDTELEIDIALQIDIDNIRRQVLLSTEQVLDTTYITELPSFVSRNNDFNLFFFIFASNSYNAQVKVISSTDNQLDRIEEKIEEIELTPVNTTNETEININNNSTSAPVIIFEGNGVSELGSILPLP